MAFSRRTLKSAAVLAGQLEAQRGAHLALTWHPLRLQFGLGGAQKAPSSAQEAPRTFQSGAKRPQEAPSGAQEAPKRPKWSPKGAQEAPSGAQEAPKRLQVEAKRRPRGPEDPPESSPRALGQQKRQLLKKWLKCRKGEQNWRSEALWGGTWRPSWTPKWRLGTPWMGGMCALAAQLGAQVPLDCPTWRPSAAGQPNVVPKGAWPVQLGAQVGILRL